MLEISYTLITWSFYGLIVFLAVLSIQTNERFKVIMAKVSQIPALLAPIVTQLTEHGDQLSAAAVQLDKAKTEILAAVDGELPAAALAAIESLGTLASNLAIKGAGIQTVAQALDALNEDAPPTDPPVVDPPVVDPQEEAEPANV